jgi:hypothetical protein
MNGMLPLIHDLVGSWPFAGLVEENCRPEAVLGVCIGKIINFRWLAFGYP